MTSTLVNKSFKVENISVSAFCTELSQTTSFFLMCLSCFPVERYLCKTPALSLFKCQNISAKYASLLNHISSKRNSANWDFPALKNWFVSFLSSTRREELDLLTVILLLYAEDVRGANLYFHVTHVFTVELRVEFEFHWRFSQRHLARFQISFIAIECSRWIKQWINNIDLCATSLIFATTPKP